MRMTATLDDTGNDVLRKIWTMMTLNGKVIQKI